MWFSSWLRNRKHSAADERIHAHVSPRQRTAFRPRLEALEDRWLPSTLTVMNNLDTGPGSLRADIATAQGGDTIIFDPSLTGQTIALTSGELAITKNLTIQGPATNHVAINGGVARVFEVDGATTNVTLSNLWIVNGQGNADSNSNAAGTNPGDGYGGGVLNFGMLTVNGCSLSGNRATYGGGIYNQGTLTVSSSTLSNNKASSSGGGICNGGGVFLGGTMTVSSCTLSANFATNGGGISNNIARTATVTESTLSHNGATYGGGIYNRGTITVSGSTLTGNTATSKGGGIYNTGKLTIHANIQNNNVAPLGADLYNLGTATIS